MSHASVDQLLRDAFYPTKGTREMRWIASMIWALIASLTTNGAIAFMLGGLDHAWIIVTVSGVWLIVFLRACPKIYDTSSRPTPAG